MLNVPTVPILTVVRCSLDKPSCPLRRLQLLFRVVNEDFPTRSTLLAPRGNEEFPQSG